MNPFKNVCKQRLLGGNVQIEWFIATAHTNRFILKPWKQIHKYRLLSPVFYLKLTIIIPNNICFSRSLFLSSDTCYSWPLLLSGSRCPASAWSSRHLKSTHCCSGWPPTWTSWTHMRLLVPLRNREDSFKITAIAMIASRLQFATNSLRSSVRQMNSSTRFRVKTRITRIPGYVIHS